jgi:hypothetical protein
MYIEDIVGLIKDPKINIEIIEKLSGASFGFYNNKYVPINLLNKQALEINVQYVNGKRCLIIKF